MGVWLAYIIMSYSLVDYAAWRTSSSEVWNGVPQKLLFSIFTMNFSHELPQIRPEKWYAIMHTEL